MNLMESGKWKEMNKKRTSCRQPANDTPIVNPVETRCIASLQSQSQPASVQTQFIVSSPYFPPYLTDKTTSVARGMSSLAQPYYLIYYMKGRNKGLRLAYVYASMATEAVSFDIRSKIRYGATTAGIPVETQDVASVQPQSASVETRCIASLHGNGNGNAMHRVCRIA